jgi:hypothetical protein
MKLFIALPRFVEEAFPPRQSVRAVRMALFPLPLCPMMKFIKGPNGILK